MIIRCPECTTGFNLPDQNVTPKGVKLRCSRCGHVFRVRADAAGEPEIYYQSGDNEEETKSSSPFPHAGAGLGGLKPKQSSAFADVSGEDPGTEEALEMEALKEESEAEELEEAPEPEAKAPPAAASAPPAASEPAPEEEEEPAPLMGSGSAFGDASDHVDPSFGTDGPVFDPEKGKVEAGPQAGPKKKAGKRPVGARGVPPTQQKALSEAAEKEASAPAPKKAAPSATWDEEDFQPHRIGGSPGTKAAVFLLILSLVVMGFFGVVAWQNEGFIDFRDFPQMLQVAFGDGEYQPRPEWAPPRPANVVVAPEDPVTVESVHGQVVQVGRDGAVFVVKGMVRNNENRVVDGVELRALITTTEGRVLQNVSGTVGQSVQFVEFEEQSSPGEAVDLVARRGGNLQARDLAPFTMVFDEVPYPVLRGGDFLLRVEVANQPEREIAAQEAGQD